MTTNDKDERELMMLAYKIAGALTRVLDADVHIDADLGLNGRTDAMRITTPDHTVTVTPRLAYHEWPDPTPSAFNTPPPTVGMTHPPM
jgi:hypothetical protein